MKKLFTPIKAHSEASEALEDQRK